MSSVETDIMIAANEGMNKLRHVEPARIAVNSFLRYQEELYEAQQKTHAARDRMQSALVGLNNPVLANKLLQDAGIFDFNNGHGIYVGDDQE